MRILIINWRSIRDPLAGGADLATFEHARRWVKNYAAEVYWISPKYKKNLDSEIIEGIKFIYLATPFSGNLLNFSLQFLYFYFSVFFYYLLHFWGKIDVLIEQIHGVPYLTPLYAGQRVIIYIHEVSGRIWDLQFPFPISAVGKNLEKTLLRLFYQKNIFVTVSKSTKNALIELGLPEENIKIVVNGVSLPPAKEIAKEKNFTLVFLSRLVKMKGIERALKVFSLLKDRLPYSKMWVVGRYGVKYKRELEKLCWKLNIQDAVTFFGYVPQEEKVDLLSRAHVLLNTSYKEGWGLVNLEANRRATPVVAFDVEGNRDSVKHGVSGFLVADGDSGAMVEACLRVKKEGEILQKSALEYSRLFSWDKAAKEFHKILNWQQDA